MNAIQRVFNYRLSRARRVIENVFGILSARFRVLRSPTMLEPSKAIQVTSACCTLHNFLMSRKSSMDCNSNFVDHYTQDGTLVLGDWRSCQETDSFYNLQPHRSYIAQNTSAIREEFSQYFVEDGEVSYHYKHI